MNKSKKVVLLVVLSTLFLSGALTYAYYQLGDKFDSESLALRELTEEELVKTFKEKKQIDPALEVEATDGLLAQIKSEQKTFNEEGHGYFLIKGDSMTPNFYEGDAVKLVSTDYVDGDYVALTINATGEHLIKQFVGGELVSSNASGGYYQLEDVTIHGTVEQVQTLDVEVNQTLQAATGIYVVDSTITPYSSSKYSASMFVLLSNGDVYARHVNGTADLNTLNEGFGYWQTVTNGQAKWYRSGNSVPVSANSYPVNISSTPYGDNNYNASIFVLLSNGNVYARHVNAIGDLNTLNEGIPYWQTVTNAQARWYLSGTSIPQALVQPPNSGSLSVPQARIVGRTSAGAGDAEYLTAGQTKQMLESTDLLFYPVGTTAVSVGMVEVRSIDATTKFWQSNIGGVPIHHTVKLYVPPTSIGDLSIK